MAEQKIEIQKAFFIAGNLENGKCGRRYSLKICCFIYLLRQLRKNKNANLTDKRILYNLGMNKENQVRNVLLCIILFASLGVASEICNVKNSNPGIPEGSCTQSGYVCHLAFDTNNSQNVIAFYLGADSLCSSLQTTKFITKKQSDNTTTNALHLFLIESEEFHTDALAMTLSGALALSASNNRSQISVIYHKVKKAEYGGSAVHLTASGNSELRMEKKRTGIWRFRSARKICA